MKSRSYLEHFDKRYNKKYGKYGVKFDFAGGNGVVREGSVKDTKDLAEKLKRLRDSVINIHQPIFDMVFDYLFLEGGRGGGKSESVARLVICESFNLAYKDKNILCLRKIQDSIDVSVKPLLAQVIGDYGLEKYFKVTDREIYNRVTKLSILFKGAKDYQALMSIKSFTNSVMIWFEEAQLFSKEDYQTIIPTFTRFGSKFVFTFNRFLEADAVWQEYIDLSQGNWREFVEEEIELKTEHIYSTYMDNELIDKKFVIRAEQLKHTSEAEYNHVYLGLPGGKYIAFPKLSKEHNGFSDSNFRATDYPWYISMDWGYGNTAIGFYCVYENPLGMKVIIKFDEMKISYETPESVARIIKEKRRNLNNKLFRFAVADPSIFNNSTLGPSVADLFAKEGVYFKQGYNDRKAGYLRLRTLLDNQQLLVMEDLVYFWEMMPNLVMSDKKDGDIFEEGVDDHGYDETRYAVMSIVLPR